ncbi:MAG: hypothetical protein M1831_003830 [Alyxoria varia]|nr:MAG: hypothetical protein M1831_003830 [Alyxoria varia]
MAHLHDRHQEDALADTSNRADVAGPVTDDPEPVATEPLQEVVMGGQPDEETQTGEDHVHERKMRESGMDEEEEEVEDFRRSEGRGAKASSSSSSENLKPSRLTKLHRNQTNDTTGTTASTLSKTETSRSLPPVKRPWWQLLLGKSRYVPPIPKERTVSREYRANIFSHLTFQWMSPLMSAGYQRPLELNDIWLVNPNRQANFLSNKVEASFKKRVERGDKRPLLGAMHETFKFEFYLGGVAQLTASVIQVVNPFVLRYLIQFAGEAYIAQTRSTPAPAIERGVGLVIAITILQLIQSLCTNQFMYRGMVNGGQARSVMISLIFDKAMKISARARAGGKADDSANVHKEDSMEEGRQPEKQKWYKNMKPKAMKNPKMAKSAGRQGILEDGQGYTNGRILNLMSVDTYRIDQASGMFHLIWTAPIAILITLILLLVNLKASALAGFALLVIATPVLGKAIASLITRRKAINKITDQRVSLTSEVLHAVRFVKLFGWETSFLQRVANIRNREVRGIQYLLAIRNGINAVSMSMPIFASMLAFIAYAYTHTQFRPDLIFSSLALFNSLRLPLNMLPMVLGQVTDAVSSVRRIQDFLLAEEEKDECAWDPDCKNAIEVQDGTFTWERSPSKPSDTGEVDSSKNAKEAKDDEKAAKKVRKDHEKHMSREQKNLEKQQHLSQAEKAEEPERKVFTINDLDFSIGRNELVAVIGGVGSGKSSLLAALAGDMRKTSGSFTMGSTRAFCPQYAWIQNASVKENILFGTEMDKTWYNQVIDACGLRADLDMLPSGDLTEIGEKGITVSGGQKQRLNIARAIYYNANIVLMDDPLSAVDAHVGRHIMDNAICGLLKDKARVLATHQLWVLSRCDRIIWMDGGRVIDIGSFSNLMANNADFSKLIHDNAEAEQREKKKGDEDDEVDAALDGKKPKKQKKKPTAALMQAEEKAVSSVTWGVYHAYIKSAGSILWFPVVMFMLILSQGSNIVTSLWLSWWTDGKFGYSRGMYVGGYAAFGFIQALLLFVFSVTVTILGTRSSKVMLHRAITRVLRAPMSFFDTTPLGRITNRFSKDIDTMDNTLTDSIRFFLMTMAMIVSVFMLIIAYYYYFAVALAPLFVIFLFSASYYRASAREIKRHESLLRSHVFSRFSEAVTGISTIRAYGLQHRFSQTLRSAVDEMDSAYYLTFANQRWLSTRLDFIGILLVFTVGILVVTSRFSISPSTGGLVLSYILSIVQMIQFTIRQLAEVENNMNSTERVHYYGTQLEQEAPLSLPNEDVTPEWPAHGEIEFKDVAMRYRPGLPLVLKDFSLHVRGGERIGVVGRTGAGKSSIMSTLFRLVELSGGQITVDGVDIAKVGLGDLRSRMAIIPQDPTLFRGTVRSNLDPFGKHGDHELWNALRAADLVGERDDVKHAAADEQQQQQQPHIEADEKTRTSSSSSSSSSASPAPTPTSSPQAYSPTDKITLDTPTSEEGLNFSLGQRQLMALARALVRHARIIICDEATSSVDMATDERIQRSMRAGFAGSTVLCIAHRLRTVLGYDRVVVMDSGGIVECGEPWELWQREDGVFRGMCERGGVRERDFEIFA